MSLGENPPESKTWMPEFLQKFYEARVRQISEEWGIEVPPIHTNQTDEEREGKNQGQAKP